MVEGGLCPKRAAGSKSQDWSWKVGGSHVGWKQGAVYTVFPTLFLGTELLSEIWEWEITKI